MSLITYLRSLDAVRDRSQQVFDLAVEGKLDHWDWHAEKLDVVVDYCIDIIKRDFGTNYEKIPPHCRKNHFLPSIDRISALLAKPGFPDTPHDRAKALIDLYLVSVLLDAGAGPDWVYVEREGSEEIWRGGRSEGLAVASLDMFKSGLFGKGYTVDATTLQSLTPETLAQHLQVTDTNPMAGLQGRCDLLIKLGGALSSAGMSRPGDLLDRLSNPLQLSDLWSTLFALLLPIWPSRTTLPSHPTEALGDIWPCPALERHLGPDAEEGASLVPFHKLTQWLCYSLVEAIEGTAGWTIIKGRGQTGLPEYRNGGLLMDLGLITLRDFEGVPRLEAGHPAVVEWRAITVITLDLIHERICAKLGADLSLAQVLEAATWKGGRETAKKRGGAPPIDIISDGTVF